MDDPAQVRAYADADFEVPHAHCVSLLVERCSELPARGCALDLGCGPGDITFRVARALPGFEITGVDGAPRMLERARRDALAAGLGDRVRFEERLLDAQCVGDAPGARPEGYALIFSNSLLHHLKDPSALWSAIGAWARPASQVFVMDLLRPESQARADALVEQYAAEEAPVLKRDFRASLLAAYRRDEVAEQLSAAGLSALQIEVVSDRHWIVWGRVA